MANINDELIALQIKTIRNCLKIVETSTDLAMAKMRLQRIIENMARESADKLLP